MIFRWSSSHQLLREYTAWHVGLMFCLMAGKIYLMLIGLVFLVPTKWSPKWNSPHENNLSFACGCSLNTSTRKSKDICLYLTRTLVPLKTCFFDMRINFSIQLQYCSEMVNNGSWISHDTLVSDSMRTFTTTLCAGWPTYYWSSSFDCT